MKNKFMALIAALFAFTYLANGEDFFSVSVKGGTNIWDMRSAGFYCLDKDNKITKQEYCSDKRLSGFFRTHYGVTIDSLFNIGAGFSAGIGLTGFYESPFGDMVCKALKANGENEGTESKELKNDAINSAVKKANGITVAAELVIKYTFVDLDPVSLYAIGRAGMMFPTGLMQEEVKYAEEIAKAAKAAKAAEAAKPADAAKDAKDAKPADAAKTEKNQEINKVYNLLSNHLLSLGIGMNWMGMEAEIAFERTARAYTVKHGMAAKNFTEEDAKDDKKTKTITVGSEVIPKDESSMEPTSVMGVNFKLGYIFGIC